MYPKDTPKISNHPNHKDYGVPRDQLYKKKPKLQLDPPKGKSMSKDMKYILDLRIMQNLSISKITKRYNEHKGYNMANTWESITEEQIKTFINSKAFKDQVEILIKQNRSEDSDMNDLLLIKHQNMAIKNRCMDILLDAIDIVGSNDKLKLYNMKYIGQIYKDMAGFEIDLHKHKQNLDAKYKEIETKDNDSTAITEFLDRLSDKDE